MSATSMMMTISGGAGTRMITIANSNADADDASTLSATLSSVDTEHKKISAEGGGKGGFSVVTSLAVDGTPVGGVGGTYNGLKPEQVSKMVMAAVAPILGHAQKHI